LAQLKLLADAYHRTITYFLDDSVSAPDIVLWRSRPESPTAASLEARLIELAEQYRLLEEVCERSVEPDLPWETKKRQFYGYAEARHLALRTRQDLGLGDRPGQSLLHVLEEVRNVKVFHFDFVPSGTAACSLTDRYGAAVLLNSRNVRWRRNFDLAHELFHLLTWKLFRTSGPDSISIPSEFEEKLATCFARNLLMPEEVFRDTVDMHRDKAGVLSVDGLLEVAREFDVSTEAVVWHIGFVYHLTNDQIESVLARVRQHLWKWDRNGDTPPERPKRFVALARQALRNGLISTGKYADYIGVTRIEAMQVAEEEAEADVQIEIAHS
jgi:Zn-dependent peptidase ImmA (M78 family)